MIWLAPAGRRGLAAALLSVALAIPMAIVESAPAAAAPSGSPIPCPKAVAPKVSRPPRPSPPPDNPAQRVVGGEQLATSGMVLPEGAGQPPAVTAISWVVADLDTGAILGACGPHESATPASVQKLLLVDTMISKLDPKQVVTVTHEDLAIQPGTSLVGLVEGGRYSIETLWLGLLLESGNDAANVLARIGGGGPDKAAGVQMMNDEATRLGAFQTHAVTPSGLDAPGQFTSAYDLALIARACFGNETFRRYTLTKRANIPAQPPKYPKGFQIQNENQLIFKYPGALGGKTGFTDLARHTYVGMAERGGRRLVVTLLGAEPRPLRGWQQGAKLLDWGFTVPAGANVGRLVEPGEVSPSPSPSAASPKVPALAGNAGPATNGGIRGLALPVMFAGAVAVASAVLAMALRRRRRGQR